MHLAEPRERKNIFPALAAGLAPESRPVAAPSLPGVNSYANQEARFAPFSSCHSLQTVGPILCWWPGFEPATLRVIEPYSLATGRHQHAGQPELHWGGCNRAPFTPGAYVIRKEFEKKEIEKSKRCAGCRAGYLRPSGSSTRRICGRPVYQSPAL